MRTYVPEPFYFSAVDSLFDEGAAKSYLYKFARPNNSVICAPRHRIPCMRYPNIKCAPLNLCRSANFLHQHARGGGILQRILSLLPIVKLQRLFQLNVPFMDHLSAVAVTAPSKVGTLGYTIRATSIASTGSTRSSL